MSGATTNQQVQYTISSDTDTDNDTKFRKKNKKSNISPQKISTPLKKSPGKSSPMHKQIPKQNFGSGNNLTIPLQKKRSRSSSLSNHDNRGRKRSPSPFGEERKPVTRSRSPMIDKTQKTLTNYLSPIGSKNIDSGKKRKMSADDGDGRMLMKMKEGSTANDNGARVGKNQNDDFDSKSNKRNNSDDSDSEISMKLPVLSSKFSNTFDHLKQPFIYKVFQLPRDRTKVFWIYPFYSLNQHINNLISTPEDELKPSMDYSESFPTQNGWSWKFFRRIHPSDIQRVYFGLAAFKDESEHLNDNWKRYIIGYLYGYQTAEKLEKKKSINPPRFISEADSELYIDFKTANMDLQDSGQFVIECLIKSGRASNYDSKVATKYVGLVNAGNTCYMNSFLQTIYLISALTRAVLKLPYKAKSEEDEDRDVSMIEALQKLFFNLKFSNKAVSTSELIRSFGWDTRDAWVQHDVQEFKCVLLDALEREMNQTKDLNKEIPRLLGGRLENYIECINVNHESKREEIFYDLLLTVKGNSNIMLALKNFLEEETLEGDNKYDAEKLGKQDARKGIRLKALPPILIFQLKRFYYDHAKLKNIKITDKCEYEDEIDLKEFIKEPYKACTEYKLFSVLVHCGEGSSSGHYYAFIRPKMGKWFKFDDDIVECASDMQVFSQNFGGDYEEGIYDKFSGKIEMKLHPSITTAYMLFYIRKDEVKTILHELTEKEIPKHLFDIAERNKLEEEERKKKSELLKVFITTFPLIKEFSKSRGILYNKDGAKDDEYKWRFIKNKMYRYLWRVSKSITCKEFLDELSKISGWNQEKFIVFKILYSSERIKFVTINKNYKKSATNSGMTLKNAYFGNNFNQNTTPHPVLLMIPIGKIKRDFFKPAANFEEDSDNILEFDNSPLKNNRKMDIENDEEQVYESIVREEQFLCFIKVYYFDSVSKSYKLELIDYKFYSKDLLLLEIDSELKTFVNEYYNLEKRSFNLTLYKEDNEQKLIEDIELTTKLPYNGTVLVVEIRPLSDNINFMSVKDYYEKENNKVKVLFLCESEGVKDEFTLQMDMKGNEITDYLSKHLFKGKHPANRIILKSYESLKKVYKEVIPIQDKRLSDLIRFDEKIYVDISPISMEEMKEKFALKLHFLSKSNQMSPQKELICGREITCGELLSKIIEEKLFETEIAKDNNRKKSIRALFLDSKKKILSYHTSKTFYQHPVYEMTQKGQSLRIESNDELVVDDLENNFIVYCSHYPKEGEIFENSFVLRIEKNCKCKELIEYLYQNLKQRKLEYEKKPIAFTRDYFDKLRLNLKNENNAPSSKIINLEPSDALVSNYKKTDTPPRFYLEIQHTQLFSSSSSNALKIFH